MTRKAWCTLLLGFATAAGVAVLPACGGAKQSADSFVGSWADPDQPGVSLVIEQRGSHYVAVAAKHGQTLRLDCSRDGNTLTAETRPAGFVTTPIARYDPTAGTLYFSPFGRDVTLRRLSGPGSGSP